MTKNFLCKNIEKLCDRFEKKIGIHAGIFDEVVDDFRPIYEELKTIRDCLRFDVRDTSAIPPQRNFCCNEQRKHYAKTVTFSTKRGDETLCAFCGKPIHDETGG